MPDNKNKVTPQPSPEDTILIIPDEPTKIGTTSIPSVKPLTSPNKLQETFNKAAKNNSIPPPQDEESIHAK